VPKGQRHNQRGRQWSKQQRAEAIHGSTIREPKLDRGGLTGTSRRGADTKWAGEICQLLEDRVTLRCLMFPITPRQMWRHRGDCLTHGTASFGPFIEGHAEVSKRCGVSSCTKFPLALSTRQLALVVAMVRLTIGISLLTLLKKILVTSLVKSFLSWIDRKRCRRRAAPPPYVFRLQALRPMQRLHYL
jgi:hypothetical protein